MNHPRIRRLQFVVGLAAPSALHLAKAEAANIAWTAAAAYRYVWSRFHDNDLLRKWAFLLLDTIAQIRTGGKWDDGGRNAYFGVHSFSWAALSWLGTGAVDESRAKTCREAVARAANDGLVCLHYCPTGPLHLPANTPIRHFRFTRSFSVCHTPARFSVNSTDRDAPSRCIRIFKSSPVSFPV